jgi:nucleoside-diphosphate-sugar epimerase
MEYMSKLWMDKLPIFIVRPFNYTGKGQNENFVIPKITSHFIQKKEWIELGNINVFREFNDVNFIVDIYAKLLFKEPVGEIFNICTGRSYCLEEVVALCSKLTNHKLKILTSPNFVRANEIHNLSGCNDKLRQIIPIWKGYTLEQTLKSMLT